MRKTIIGQIKETEGVYIAPTASVMGDVSIGKDSSIWYGTIVRGDENQITIGSRTNIQDNSVVHTDSKHAVEIGDNVTIGHGCIIHGCVIGSGTMVGMGAIVMNGARIGEHCLIGAGALVTENTEVPDGSLILGSPAKVKRSLTTEEMDHCIQNAEQYVRDAISHFG